MNTNQALIATMWDLDVHGEIGRKDEYDDGAYEREIADALKEALEEESADIVRSEDGICVYGYYNDSHEIEIYWWHTNASSEWSADRPDWWDTRGQVEG